MAWRLVLSTLNSLYQLGGDPAMPTQPRSRGQGDSVLSLGAGIARRPNGEDEPAMAEVDRLDPANAITPRQCDHVTRSDIPGQDDVFHATRG